MPKVDYGLDWPIMVRRLTSRAILLVVFAAALYFVNRANNPVNALAIAIAVGTTGLALGFAAGTMVFSSRVAKLRLRDAILDSIAWRGDESVLDVGCGRGTFLIGAAKRLKKGVATGVDIWNPQQLSGNNREAALATATAEGVEKRVKVETADARKLPFADSSFDIVLSSLAINGVGLSGDRRQALTEINRVLKPGGRVAILDIMYTRKYADVLRELGYQEILFSPLTLLWCVPTRSVTARKPL